MSNLDTRSKRASSVNLLKPYQLALVLPDGAFDQGDRQHIVGDYSGLAAQEPTPSGGVPPVGVPRWPLSLHLYETMGGALIYTFPSPEGVTITDNEHGFESLTGFQPMRAHQAFWLYDLAPAKWVVLSCGGFSVWEGRLEDRKIQRGGFGFTAFGAKRYLDDILYTAVWSTKSFAGIRPVTADEVAKSTPERWAMDNNNRVWFGLVAGETYGVDDNYGMQVWREPHLQNGEMTEIEFDYTIDLPTDWELRVLSAAENFSGGAGTVEATYISTGVPATATGNIVAVTGPPAKAYLSFQVRNNTGAPVTYAGATGVAYAKVTNFRIRGSLNNAIYADEIISSMLVYANNLTLSFALIQSPNVDLTDELFEDMRISDVISYLADKGDDQTPPHKWEWGVWEDKTLYFRPQGSAALAWYVDADEFALDSTLESLINRAYVTYQDPNGRTLRTATSISETSFEKYGIIREGMTSERTTSNAKAVITRTTLINSNKEIAPRASLTLYGLFDAAGARYPLWMARAGDTITIRNLPPTLSTEIDRIRTFRMSRKSYNVDSDILTPTPEFGLPTLSLQIASALTYSGASMGNLTPKLTVNPQPSQPSFS